MNDYEVEIVLNASNKTGRALGGLEKRLKGVGGVARNISKLVAGIGAGAVIGGAVFAKKSIDRAIEFDRALREVGTLTPEVAKNLDSFRGDVLKLSSSLGVNAVDSTKALYQAISAGIPPGNAIDFLAIASRAAIGGVTDTETAVDGLTTVMNAFASQGISAEQAADVMFATVKAGKTDFAQLSASLFNVAPLAAASGVAFEEVSATLATLTAQGTPTAVATTQIRAAIQALLKPSDDLTEIFQAAGFASGEMAVQQIGLAASADIVRKATGGSVSGMTALLGSIEGVQGILGITGDNADAFAKNVDNMAASAGAADAAFGVMSEGAGFSFDKLGTFIENIQIQLGTALLPVLKEIAERAVPLLESAIDSVRTFFDQHGEKITGFFDKLGAVVAFIADNWDKWFKPVLIGLGLLLVAITAVTVGVGIFNAILAINPFIALAIAIVVIIALIVANWDSIVKKTTEIWNGISGFLSGIWGAITGKVTEVWNGIRDFFVGIWDAIVEKTTEVWNGIKEFFVGIWEAIVGFFQDNWDKILAILFPAVGIPLLIARNWETITKFFGGLWEGVTGIFKNAVNGILGLAEGMANGFIGAINGIIQAWNRLELKLGGKRIDLPFGQSFTIPSITLGTPNIPTIPRVSIPRLQTGGTLLSDGLFFGHRGERIFNPARVDRNNNQGRTVVVERIIVQGNILDGDQLGRKFRRALDRDTIVQGV